MRNNNDLISMIELCWSFSSNSLMFAQLASRPDPRAALPLGLQWSKPDQKGPLNDIGQMLQTLANGTQPDWSSLPNTIGQGGRGYSNGSDGMKVDPWSVLFAVLVLMGLGAIFFHFNPPIQ